MFHNIGGASVKHKKMFVSEVNMYISLVHEWGFKFADLILLH